MCIEGPWVFGQGGWAYGFDVAADKAQIYYDPLERVADGGGGLRCMMDSGRQDPISVTRSRERSNQELTAFGRPL
jgi:hypothetical protein